MLCDCLLVALHHHVPLTLIGYGEAEEDSREALLGRDGARVCVERAQAIILPPAFEGIKHLKVGYRSVAANLVMA